MANKTIKINGTEYAVADLNPAARNMLGNIEVADQKIASLQQELALMKVARETLGRTLLASLPAAVATPEAAQ